jgi:5-methylcytosine-specific restriction endonuclease McrA
MITCSMCGNEFDPENSGLDYCWSCATAHYKNTQSVRLLSQPRGTTKRRRHTKTVRDAVYKRDGGRCVECRVTRDLQYDHIIPLSRGGNDSIENTQLLCARCNMKKGNRSVT